MVGGVQVETRCALLGIRIVSSTCSLDHDPNRYTGVDTLDEPVATTIVRFLRINHFSLLIPRF